MEYNRRFLCHNNIDEVLQSMFRQPEEGEAAQELTASEIAEKVRSMRPDMMVNAINVGRRMKANGFECVHGKNGNYYIVNVL